MSSDRARTHFLAVAVLAVAVFAAGCPGIVDSGPPTVTVQNHDDAPYRVSAYAVDVETAADVVFEVTTGEGDTRYVSATELRFGGEYRDPTLAYPNASARTETVESGSTRSYTLEGWESGDTTVYVFEHPGNSSVLGGAVVECERGGQTHNLTIEDGFYSEGSFLCA